MKKKKKILIYNNLDYFVNTNSGNFQSKLRLRGT